MILSWPLFRLRRVRSELFHEGYLRRVRQHFALELGVRDDVRAQLAKLQGQVARLTAELARQEAVAAIAGAAAPAPALCPRCSGAEPRQPRIGTRRAPRLPVREPERPVARPLTDDAREVIVLIADKSWP
jgi:hypothetical protein